MSSNYQNYGKSITLSQLVLAICYTSSIVLDFTQRDPLSSIVLYWIEVAILILQYLCFILLSLHNFEWPILSGMINQFDILTLTVCILFLFCMDANQLKFLSLFWIIGMDCIRSKDTAFLIYVLLLAIISSMNELFHQLLQKGQITDYLVQNVQLHPLTISAVFIITIRLSLPLYKLRPFHYSMSKKLLFVRKSRYRRDLLRFVNMRLHRKSKAETLTISHTNGQIINVQNELFPVPMGANLYRNDTQREWRTSKVTKYQNELEGAIAEQKKLMESQNINIDEEMQQFMSDNDDGYEPPSIESIVNGTEV